MRTSPRPVVVFVDHAKWDCFFQLGARIRKAGVRVVRVSTAAGWHHRLVARLVFHRFVAAGGEDGLSLALARLGEAPIVDVQATERVLGAALQGLRDSVAPAVLAPLQRRLALDDKLAARSFFERCGAGVPEVVVLSRGTSAEGVVARLGLPVVVKERTGASGDGVRIVRSEEELAALLASLAGPEDHYAERFVRGEALSYGAMVGAAGVDQEVLTRAWHRRGDGPGPASMHETLDHDRTAVLCREIAEATGCRGPVQVDVVLDGRGEPFMLDLNLRAWGDAGAALAAGIDLSEGYLRAIGLRTGPPAVRRPRAGLRYAVFPTDLSEEIASGHPLAALGCLRRAAGPYGRWFGTRYVLGEVLSAVFLVHHVMRQAARRRRAAPA